MKSGQRWGNKLEFVGWRIHRADLAEFIAAGYNPADEKATRQAYLHQPAPKQRKQRR